MDTLSDNSKSEPVRVGIIGCGWLGKALVKALVEQTYYVIATTQQQLKLKSITDLGAQAEILTLPFGDVNENSAAVFCCETLIICIPPGIRKGKKDYPDKIADIIKQAEHRHVNKVILFSTTAVYEGILGDVTESAKLNKDNEKVKILTKAEQYVLGFSNQGIVIRCAGLVGPNRHPGIFFKNKKLLTAPNAYVNLVHQTDVVEQIILLITKDIVSGVFNIASDMQVTKKHYYSIAAKALNVPLPLFDEHSEVELGKKVLSDKLRDELGYHYQYDDLVTWLINSELDSKN
jgi:nucleoside-diphosphate-sugar epimerase